MHCGEILALLGENAMAVQIAVEAKITQDVKGVIDVLERPAELIAAVAAFGEVFFEYLAAFFNAHLSSDLAQLHQRVTRVRVKNRRDDFFFGRCIAIDQRHRLAGSGRGH